MRQGSSVDMSKLSAGDKIVLGAAGAYVVWALLPTWYRHAGDGTSNGLTGVTLIAWLVAIAAIAEIVLRVLSGKTNLPIKGGALHVAAAAIALLLTILAVAIRPSGSHAAWGVYVAIVVALAWTYGAYMMYSQPDTGPLPRRTFPDSPAMPG